MSGERLYWSIMGPIVALLFMLGCWGLYEGPAHAQPNGQNPDQTIAGIATNRSTVLAPAVIATGLTYQLLLPAISPSDAASTGVRRALFIENNLGNTSTDLCYILIATPQIASQITAATTTSSNLTGIVSGASVTATAAKWSQTYSVGGAYNRTWPYVPSDAIYGTCTTMGDVIYVETQ